MIETKCIKNCPYIKLKKKMKIKENENIIFLHFIGSDLHFPFL